MNCSEVRERLLAYLEGDPQPADGDVESVRVHLAGCPACRAEAEALREQVALLRGTGAWAAEHGMLSAARALRPGPAGSLPAIAAAPKPARPERRWHLWARAAIAAAALLALGGTAWMLRGRFSDGQAGRLVGVLHKGQILLAGMPAETLHAGGRYAVPAGRGAVVRLDQYATLWISGSSRFTVGSGPGLTVELCSGSLMCQSIVPVEVRSLTLRAQGCGRFALAVPGGDEPKGGDELAAPGGWGNWLFPRAEAVEPNSPEAAPGPAAFLLLSGWTNLRVGEEELSLVGRRAVLGGDGKSLLVGAPEGLLASAAAERRRLLSGLASPRYRTMLAEFSARRASYLTRLTAGDLDDSEREDLTWRIAVMDLLRETHQAHIERLSQVERPREERAELLEAGMECLQRLMQDVVLAERRMAAVAH